MEPEESWRERVVKAAMLDDVDPGCVEICGNQSFSMTSTWSRVFRYFSLRMRANQMKVRRSNAAYSAL